MRRSVCKILIVLASLLLTSLIYAMYVVATVANTALTAIAAAFTQIGAMVYAVEAFVLVLYLLLCFVVMGPIEFGIAMLGWLRTLAGDTDAMRFLGRFLERFSITT